MTRQARHRFAPQALVVMAALVMPAAASAQFGTAYLTRRLTELQGQYAAGMNAWGPVQTGSLNRGARRHFDLVLPAGACYKFIAVGDGDVADLDLHVRRATREVARDTAVDNFPVASHCTTDQARVDVELHIVRGRGEFAFSVFQGPVGTMELTPGSPQPTQTSLPTVPAQPGQVIVVQTTRPAVIPTDALGARLFELAATFAPGSVAFGAPRRGSMNRGDEQNHAIRLEAGHCYTVIAVGAPSATDVDLELFDPNRRRVARDRERNNFPHVSHCAALPAPYEIRVKMHRGEGPFILGVFDQTGGSASIVPAPAPMPAAPPAPAPAPGADALSARLTELAATFAPGQAPASRVFRGAMSTHGRQDFAVNLQAGRCYTILAVAAPSATDLDIYLFDPNRDRRTSDRERNNMPHITFCASLPGPHTIRVQMYRGEGPFVMQAFAQ
ncbi:MAG: hypothetical protein HYY06_06800 [Deltaproteobacteria bacterium]|nr:hypothetical protein [Deltaproteobacteria bacterium]